MMMAEPDGGGDAEGILLTGLRLLRAIAVERFARLVARAHDRDVAGLEWVWILERLQHQFAAVGC